MSALDMWLTLSERLSFTYLRDFALSHFWEGPWVPAGSRSGFDPFPTWYSPPYFDGLRSLPSQQAASIFTMVAHSVALNCNSDLCPQETLGSGRILAGSGITVRTCHWIGRVWIGDCSLKVLWEA